ncbi:MAG: hypothetical protein ABSE73_22055 [Planctomycetota bacterium]
MIVLRKDLSVEKGAPLALAWVNEEGMCGIIINRNYFDTAEDAAQKANGIEEVLAGPLMCVEGATSKLGPEAAERIMLRAAELGQVNEDGGKCQPWATMRLGPGGLRLR